MRSDGFLIGILLACCCLVIGALAFTQMEIKEYKHGYQEKEYTPSESQIVPPVSDSESESEGEEESPQPTEGETNDQAEE
jgi:predicted outer membrane lipoprotein